MPLVFVHGVSTRDGPDYRSGIDVKRRFFDLALKNVVVNGKVLDPVCVDERTSFPYWGDLASKFHWNMKSLPGKRVDTLGGVESPDLGSIVASVAEIAPAAAEDPNPLRKLAQTEGLEVAVAVLNETIIAGATDEERQAVADLVFQISRYAEKERSPQWVHSVETDAAFLELLIAKSSDDDGNVTTLGVVSGTADVLRKAGGLLAGGFGRVRDLGGYAVSAGVAKWKREAMNVTIGQFVGDVFRYLVDCRAVGKGPAIGPRVVAAIEAAKAMPGPLVVVAHSLGGVIMYDVLTHDAPNIEVDVLITVGSQVGFFEEMKLYRKSDEGIPSTTVEKLPRPSSVQRWLNFYDLVDFFAYLCEPVFNGVSDWPYSTRNDSIKAHSAYFQQLSFYHRLRERIEAKS